MNEVRKRAERTDERHADASFHRFFVRLFPLLLTIRAAGGSDRRERYATRRQRNRGSRRVTKVGPFLPPTARSPSLFPLVIPFRFPFTP